MHWISSPQLQLQLSYIISALPSFLAFSRPSNGPLSLTTPLRLKGKARANLVRRLREVLGIDAEAETDGGVRAHLDIVGESGNATVVDFALHRESEIRLCS